MTTTMTAPAPADTLAVEIRQYAARLAAQAPELTPERLSAVVSIVRAGGGHHG